MNALQFAVSVPQYAALKVLGSISRRCYYDGPLATVKLVDVLEPPLPSPDWVRIKTSICGFCGSDLNLILLRDSPTASPFTSFPCTIGHELSGEVTEVGSNVRQVKAGDPVTICPTLGCAIRGIEPECAACRMGRPANCENMAEGSFAPGMFVGICRDLGGGFAPYLVAHESQVYRLPEGVSLKDGAMMEPLAVTIQAVLENMPGHDDHVLIVGGGVIGNLIVQTIRAFGVECSITVAEPSPFHAELAAKSGANHLITEGSILHRSVSITRGKAYKPMLGPEIMMGGFSRIFDTVASTRTLNADLRVLRSRGELSIVGISKEARFDLTPLWLKLQTVRGVYCYGYNTFQGQKKHAFEMAIEFARQKKVRLEPMITHAFLLQDYREMIEVNLRKGKHKAVKTVVTFDSGKG